MIRRAWRLAPLYRSKALLDSELFAANFLAQLRSLTAGACCRRQLEGQTPLSQRSPPQAVVVVPWSLASKGSVEVLGNERFARIANSAGSYIGATKPRCSEGAPILVRKDALQRRNGAPDTPNPV